MASFDNNTMRGFRKEGKYTSSELSSSTLDDGTKVVTAPITNIKRRICGGIDVHKSVLMACACVTDKETLSAVFYVRQFPQPQDFRYPLDGYRSLRSWYRRWCAAG